MNADRTVEALKTILDGKTPEEIDAVVRDLKTTLDQAAADIKGEMDIDSTAVVNDLKDEMIESNPTHSTILDEETLIMDSSVYEKIENLNGHTIYGLKLPKCKVETDLTTEVSDLQSNLANSFTIGHYALNEAVRNFDVPDCVIPSESDVKIKSCHRGQDIPFVKSLFELKSSDTFNSSACVCVPEGLFGDKLEFVCSPIEANSCNKGGDVFEDLKDSGNCLSGNTKKEFIYNPISCSFYNKDGYKHDDLDDLEVTDLNSIKNTVEDMYYSDKNALDPIQPFATRLFGEKLSKIETEIYSKYNVKNNLKNIKRKQKINNFLKKSHLSRFNLSVEKHNVELNDAVKEVILKMNNLDSESCIERMQFIGEKRVNAVRESIESGKPVLYARPL